MFVHITGNPKVQTVTRQEKLSRSVVTAWRWQSTFYVLLFIETVLGTRKPDENETDNALFQGECQSTMRVTCEMLGKSLIINNCSYFMYKQRGVFIKEVKYFSFVEQI